jgi:hypothetical protein
LGREIVILHKAAKNFKYAEILMQHGNKRLLKNRTLGRFPKINSRKKINLRRRVNVVIVSHITQILGYF